MSDLNFLQERAQVWAGHVVNLHNTEVPPNMEPAKQALLTTAKGIKNAIEKITGPLKYLEPMNQLGILPVIVGTVGVAGAAALITKWTYDYKRFIKKVEERNKLMAGGLSAEQAAKVVNMSDQSKPLFQIVSPKALLFGGGAIALYMIGKRKGWF